MTKQRYELQCRLRVRSSTLQTPFSAAFLVNELESQLPERGLEIVRLSEFEGLDWKEIALLKNISPEAARKRYYRSTRTIRRVLQSQTEEGKDGVKK